jgi:hypothetical protein
VVVVLEVHPVLEMVQMETTPQYFQQLQLAVEVEQETEVELAVKTAVQVVVLQVLPQVELLVLQHKEVLAV